MAPQSVEPQIADLANAWLKQYKLDYRLEQQSLNSDIDNALNEYYSKQGGSGGNRPDCKLLLCDKYGNNWPVLIEYKGYKDKLVKLDADGHVANRNTKGLSDFKNINAYAVNGAVHYANALLHYTAYTDIIAIGITGYMDATGKLRHEIGVYYVSKSNFGTGQRVGDYTDLSFLAPKYFNAFIEKVKELCLSPKEIEHIKQRREQEINFSLVRLNNDIYQNEKGLSENDRVYLVAASIMATLGIPGKVRPLEKSELISSEEKDNRDGDIIVRKIKAFLSEKHLPDNKRDLIVRTLENTLTNDNINRPVDGESQLRRVFVKIIDDLGIYYKIGLTTDFTGRLFNEMYNWLGFTQDRLNDVVLTPSYVATLLVRLARVNMNSYVWDFATGSAGLLVAAMNEMLADAKQKIHSPEELAIVENHIKATQILGIEILPSIYMLAILNMILMGDGSSNILNKDSLSDFDGNYGFICPGEPFPADAFVLNPPYSAAGNGMVFVEKALSMMEHGYAAIIIQDSTGSGKAADYNRRVLQHSTLLASIKMPLDLFRGKSGVQTYIYVFRVGEAHQKDDIVKFIDFSNDGYTRTNRKKASNNLYDTDHACERYAELVDIVRFGRNKLHYLTEQEYYEGNINPIDGTDWNQSAPADICPNLEDFRISVSNYLDWEVSKIIVGKGKNEEVLEKIIISLDTQLATIKWGDYKLKELFNHIEQGRRVKKMDQLPGNIPFVMSGTTNQGVVGYIANPIAQFPSNSITIDIFGNAFYRNYSFGAGDDTGVYWSDQVQYSEKQMVFIAAAIRKALKGKYSFGKKLRSSQSFDLTISLPQTPNGEIDFPVIEDLVRQIEKLHLQSVLCNAERNIAATKQVVDR